MDANNDDLMEVYHDILNTCAKGLYKIKVITPDQLLEFFSKDLAGKTLFCQVYSRKWNEDQAEKHKTVKNN